MAPVDEHGQLEIDAFGRPQPVRVSEHRRDVHYNEKIDASVCQRSYRVAHRTSDAAELL